jgi:hypothetical protein
MPLGPLRDACVRPAPKSRFVVSGLLRSKIKIKIKIKINSEHGCPSRRNSCGRRRRSRRYGPRFGRGGGSVMKLSTDLPLSSDRGQGCRTAAPTGICGVARFFIAPNHCGAFDLDLASKRAISQATPIATWVQAERRWRGVGRAAWMPREPPPAMDGGWRRAHGASPSLRNSDEGGTQPGARTLGYLVSFQVTRRRRNRSGVSQSQNPTHSNPIQSNPFPQKPHPQKSPI